MLDASGNTHKYGIALIGLVILIATCNTLVHKPDAPIPENTVEALPVNAPTTEHPHYKTVQDVWREKGLSYNESHTTVTPTEHIAVTATASALNDYYQDNEVKADEDCKDKRISITGRISSIQKNYWNEPYITLNSGRYFQDIVCHVRKDDVINLHKGDKVNVIGTCKGMFAGKVQIENCIVIPE